MEIREGLAKTDVPDARTRTRLANTHQELANLYRTKQLWNEAADNFRKVVELRESVRAVDEAGAANRLDLARSYTALGAIAYEPVQNAPATGRSSSHGECRGYLRRAAEVYGEMKRREALNATVTHELAEVTGRLRACELPSARK